MAVHIAGPIFASLFYDITEDGDHMGFLLGEVIRHVTDTISDSQINASEVETRIHVYATVPCPRDQRIYNSRGEVHESQLLNILNDSHKNIVGWYSFRRHSAMRPSFRERLIHGNLAQAVTDEHPTNFVFLLCTSKHTENLSTHTFDNGFTCLTNNVFKKVPVKIINLGDTTHTEYRNIASHTASSQQGIYSSIVKQQEQEFLNSSGHMEVRSIQSLNGALNRQLQDISETVLSSETELAKLEQEVQRYRKQVKLKQLEQQQKPVPLVNGDTRISMEHDGVEEQQTSKKQSPSVDELLSMDYIDEDPSDLEAIKGQEVNCQTLSSSASKMETYTSDTSFNSVSLEKEKFVLTSPVSLHRQNSPNTVDENIKTASEQILVDLKDTDQIKTSDHKTDDPFSFVSNMMASSKKDDKVSGSRSMAVPRGGEIKLPTVIKTPVPAAMETSVVRKKEVTLKRNKSNRENAAAIAAASILTGQTDRLRSTRSQAKNADEGHNLRSKGEEKCDSHKTKKSADISTDTIENVDVKRTAKLKTMDNNSSRLRKCGQEVTKKVVIVDSDDETQEENESSPDTYGMDVASSPIY